MSAASHDIRLAALSQYNGPNTECYKTHEIRVSSSGGAGGDGRRSTPLEQTADVDSATPMALLNLTTLSVFQNLLKILATQIGKKKSS